MAHLENTFSKLHEMMDQKVDVFEENAKFDKLLADYYATRNEKYITEMWPIMYRCACNILKRRFGMFWKATKISDVATEMVMLLISRMKDTEKFPEGYPILNLPTMLGFTILNVVYGPRVLREEKEYELSYENLYEKGYIKEECYDDKNFDEIDELDKEMLQF